MIESGEADRLVLNYGHGFNEPDLEFVRGLPVRQLVILDRRLRSLAPLSALGDTLEMLSVVTDPALTIDLASFPNLTDLSCDWHQVRATVGTAPQLQRLSVGSYDQADLEPLAELTRLRRLVMMDRPRLRSLSGVQRFTDLRELSVPLANKLHDVSALRRLANLESLDLEGCRKLSTIDDLIECVELRQLNLCECGNLASLAPLRGLTALELLHIYGSTNITDGDLTPIAALPRLKELRMMSRRHYNPKVDEIEACAS
ncbi:hypothetical protein [Nocardioides sp.]|uniref:hypothetical protein n=1 Tax=Nocardioides sp. TaxID=35761 RepID=UPI002B6CBD3E|nr:hypothetical protein [Nocardioides sp.]HXH77107.1 hypothetical protein [Nocardioides sp.]